MAHVTQDMLLENQESTPNNFWHHVKKLSIGLWVQFNTYTGKIYDKAVTREIMKFGRGLGSLTLFLA